MKSFAPILLSHVVIDSQDTEVWLNLPIHSVFRDAGLDASNSSGAPGEHTHRTTMKAAVILPFEMQHSLAA